MQAIVDIVRAGKALYAGISRWPLEALKFAYDYLSERDVPLLIYQGRLNLIDRAPHDEGILDFCHSRGVGFISFSPLAQGLLTERYLHDVPEGSRMSRGRTLTPERLTPELLEYLHTLKNIADGRGENMAQTALAWILAQRGVTSTLVGASSVAQLMRNLSCINASPFSDEQLRLLK